jgi:hypothetical protein|tara:strand:+ start:2411 stop:3232 length:822 start_codon:yes stop_codon:yes gene_type:complete
VTVIEFVGIPCSGKSKFYLKLKNLLETKYNLNILNYSDLFFIFSKNIINLPFTERIILRLGYILYKRKKYLNKQIIKNYSKKTFKPTSLFKNYIKKFIHKTVEATKIKIINSLSRKEKNIFLILSRSVKNSPINIEQKEILKSRMMEELIGMHICKKINLNECMVLNDEGLYQRVLSGIGKLEKKDIHRILTDTKLLKKFTPNTIILFTNSSISKIKNRSKKRKEGFKFSDLSDKEIKTWIKIFGKFSQNYNKKIIYKIKEKNFIKILKKINK